MKTIVVAAVVSLVVSLLATPMFIRLLRRKGYGQPIRVDGPKTHATKRGTPTMGGVVFLLAAIFGYAAAHLSTDEPFTASGLLVLLMMTGLGLVGFADDMLKIFRQTSLGLRSTTKIAGQVLVAAAFGVAVLHFPNGFDLTPADARLSFLRDFGPALGMLPFVAWVILVCVGTSNAVNLTDGLDGLASGATIAVLAAYLVIGVWQERHSCASVLATGCYQVRDPLDLAVVAAAVLGGCAGYLWWNAPPAKIFMGDTGSLALGGGLAGLAICTKTQLLLAILGGLFVAVTMSDVIQVGCYKLTGRRVFKMAPLQHHFELLGWAEMTVVVRFWMMSWLCSGLGLSIFYLTWAATGTK